MRDYLGAPDSKRLEGTPFGMFYRGRRRLDVDGAPPAERVVQHTRTLGGGGEEEPPPLFPMAYPFVNEKAAGRKGRRRRRWRYRTRAHDFVGLLLGWGNWMALGCPADPARYVPYNLRGLPMRTATAATFVAPSVIQAELAERLVEDVRPLFCLCPSGPGGSSRGKQTDFMSSLEGLLVEGSLDPTVTPGALFGGGAKEVKTERARLPAAAAVCDPGDHLVGRRADIFANYPNEVRLPREEWRPELPRSCHKVSPAGERKLFAELLRTSMGELVPAEEVELRPDGEPMVGGFFAVDRKVDFDRLIYDRRRPDAAGRSLDWLRLPNRCQLADLLLRETETVRCTGTDLACYYYLLRARPGQTKVSCVGRVLKGEDFVGFGGVPGRLYYLGLRVPGMGDLNATAVAQETHECIPRRVAALSECSTVRYDSPVPRTPLWQFCYIDDLHLVLRGAKTDLARPVGDDLERMWRAQEGYLAAGLEEAKGKRFSMTKEWTTLGTHVRAEAGTVAPPMERRRELFRASVLLASSRVVSKRMVQQWAGLITPVLMHRRECMAVLHFLFKRLARLPEEGSVPLPGKLRDEVLGAGLMVVMAEAHVRWQLPPSTILTDATPMDGGAVEADIPEGVAGALYWRSCHRGGRLPLQRDLCAEAGLGVSPAAAEEEDRVSGDG